MTQLSPVGTAQNDCPADAGTALKSRLEIRDLHGALVVCVPLRREPMVVGRSATAAIRLDHATISRNHAQFFCDPFDRWWVQDLGSRNGVQINHRKVTEGVIAAGDVVRLGDFHFVLRHTVESTAIPLPTVASLPLAATPDVEVSAVNDSHSPQLAPQHLLTIMELGARLRQIADPAERTREMCSLMLTDRFCGRAAMVLRVDRQVPGNPHVLYIARSETAGKPSPFHISTTLLGKVIEMGVALMASNVRGHGPALQISVSSEILPISAVACPLNFDEKRMDLLYVVFPPEFARAEWLALTSLVATQYVQCETIWANQRDIAAHATIESDLRRARLIQQRLVPRDVVIPELDVGISFEPCQWVGGDYVDVVAMADGRVLLAVADVCGKGLQAALLASSVHTLVHSSLRNRMDLAALMADINEHLCAFLPPASFVTMIAVVLDCRTGALQYANAGHPPALVFGPNGQFRKLAAEGTPLGITSIQTPVQIDHLDSTELLAIFTDGWTDVTGPGGNLLGFAEFDQLLQSAWSKSAGATASTFIEIATDGLGAHSKGSNAADDRTFLAVRRTSR